jgi:hypothetical protein
MGALSGVAGWAVFRWENRAQSLNVEVVVDSAAAGGYRPPLPVNPDNPTAWISVNAQGRNLGVVTFELKVCRAQPPDPCALSGCIVPLLSVLWAGVVSGCASRRVEE